MSEHTHGPWEVKVLNNLGECEVRCNELYIANTFGFSDQREGTANAHLIASAPDLLDALEYLLEREWQDDEGSETLDKARSNAKAAIAKARGEV